MGRRRPRAAGTREVESAELRAAYIWEAAVEQVQMQCTSIAVMHTRCDTILTLRSIML